jgi:predicted small secreted protein
MRSRILISGVVAGSLLVSGCANTSGEDVAGALLIGAVVIGLGVLAAGVSDDDEGDYRHNRRHHDDSHRHRERSRYANNGRCDDGDYRTSNGGRARSGTDERDCARYGDGLK